MNTLQFPITLPLLDEKGEETCVSLRLPGSLPVVDVYKTDPPGGGEPQPLPAADEYEDARERKAA